MELANARAEECKADAIVFAQKCYNRALTAYKGGAEMLTLPLQNPSDKEYFALGYYKSKGRLIRKLLVVGLSSDMEEKLFLLKGALGLDQIFNLGGEVGVNNSALLMKRMHLVPKLSQGKCFGVLVSNVNTSFCQRMLATCRSLLKAHNKTHYLFMMSNALVIQITSTKLSWGTSPKSRRTSSSAATTILYSSIATSISQWPLPSIS